MSPSSMPNARVTVTVGDGQGAVEIVDGSFRVVARGATGVEADLAPGIYKARARAGGASTELLFDVDPGQETVDVSLPPPRFASPLPLQETSTSHEFHQAAASGLASGPAQDVGCGTGAALLVLLRDPDADPNAPAPDADVYGASFAGLRLRAASGEILADLDAVGEFDARLGVLGAHLQLGEGTYVLSHEVEGGAWVSMPVVAVAGWRTQIFVNLAPVPGRPRPELRPNLVERSMSMAPQGAPFDPADPMLRLTEVVRFSLATGQPGPALPSWNADETGLDPVLALLMARLILADPGSPRAAAVQMHGYASRRLGPDFPDVVALEKSLGGSGAWNSFVTPPLLRASWDALAELPGALVAGSLAHRASSRLLPDGVWTTWKDEPEAPRAAGGFESLGARPPGGVRLKLMDMLSLGAEADELVGVELPGESYRGGSAGIAGFVRMVPWGRVIAHAQRDHFGRRWMGTLTPLQKSLLLTLKLVEEETGDEFTHEEILDLHRGFGVSVPVLADSVADLALRALDFEAETQLRDYPDAPVKVMGWGPQAASGASGEDQVRKDGTAAAGEA